MRCSYAGQGEGRAAGYNHWLCFQPGALRIWLRILYNVQESHGCLTNILPSRKHLLPVSKRGLLFSEIFAKTCFFREGNCEIF